MASRRLLSPVVSLVVLAALAPAGAQAAERTVTVADFKFAPKVLTIAPGDAVVWRFKGPSVHTVTYRKNGKRIWGSGRKAPGKTYRRSFGKAGELGYFCSIHTFMRGTVKVQR